MQDNKKLIVKDNNLINAAYTLDLAEQRLILLAIIEARESNKGINSNDPLTVHSNHYAQQFGVTRQAAYWALKEAANGLFERYFRYQTKDEKDNIVKHKSRWVSEIQYVDANAVVKLIFAPAVVPLITSLERHFTSYELEQISELTSIHAIRLYELLIAWRSVGRTPVIELINFRNSLGIEENEYKRMTDFKRRVLDAAISQINAHTDITVKYDQHKKGRSISGFSFSFKQKNQPKTISTTKKSRQRITKKEAEAMAYVGENWPDLLNRLTGEYHIVDM